MNQKFGVGDIVKVRQSEELCRVVMPIQDVYDRVKEAEEDYYEGRM